MNCSYCGTPVPKSASDSRGIPLMPESVHLTCVADRVALIDQFLRRVEVDTSGQIVNFPKYAPLTTVGMTEKGE